MSLSLYISAIIIAKSLNPNFIGENLPLCFVCFVICAILQLFDIAMTMKRSIKPDRHHKDVIK